MKKRLLPSLAVVALAPALPCWASAELGTKVSTELGSITVSAPMPTSLPSQIPTTIEGTTAQQIRESINATDSEDALKYLPSLLIRKRYLGDYNHAVLASRASGTNNSARSMVYADGLLLSNYLGNGATYAPRWGMVSPDEIERVDVLYGPFSAAYPGNSVGAVVQYQTKMPKAYEAHAKVGWAQSRFRLYGTDAAPAAHHASASVGNKTGDWAWRLHFNRQDSWSQPMVFVVKTPCSGTRCTAPVIPVEGGILALSPTGASQLIAGTAGAYHTVQDHAHIKLAYDVTGTLKASYSAGYWHNRAQARPQTYLTNSATGAPVTSGTVHWGGQDYALGSNDFSMSNEVLHHVMQSWALKSNTQARFDYEVALSNYRYVQDDIRAPTSYANGINSGAGTLASGVGSGWSNLSVKATYRPQGLKGALIYDWGYQLDSYVLNQSKNSVSSHWQQAGAGEPIHHIAGRTRLESVWGQMSWRVNPAWRAVLGLRAEHWRASNGVTQNAAATPAVDQAYATRHHNAYSPKVAIAFQVAEDAVLKASVGRAVRFPTPQELYGNVASHQAQYLNDPTLQPEKSVTSEWSYERDLGNALVRTTVFFEDTRDALYSQTTLDTASSQQVTRVANVERIKSSGLELSYQGVDVGLRALDLAASLTYTESKIVENAGYVAKPGDTIGAYQPRVPLGRASFLLAYRWSPRLSTSVGGRYSGLQYTTLNNADINGDAYTAASRFWVMDARLRYLLSKTQHEETSLAFGVDNLNNRTYWNFHAYPQRTVHVELRVDWK